MHNRLMDFLCDPLDKSSLSLSAERSDDHGNIVEGSLVSARGRTYPVERGIPRLMPPGVSRDAVAPFADQWNFFNFEEFKENWLRDTVTNTFGTPDIFQGRLVVDAGGGSGMQSRWMRELGARHVICLELSDSVDAVVQKNLAGLDGVDVVQCSIDSPPIKDESVNGLVICHNVIQHTASVEATAHALWRIVAPGGELVFNCYQRNDGDVLRALRFQLFMSLRRILSPRGFQTRLAYARIMAALGLVPVVGSIIEKVGLLSRGSVSPGPGFRRRAFRQGVLNTFDAFGAHRYQHYKTDDEIRALLESLRPAPRVVRNVDAYFSKPPPVGCALRIQK